MPMQSSRGHGHKNMIRISNTDTKSLLVGMMCGCAAIVLVMCYLIGSLKSEEQELINLTTKAVLSERYLEGNLTGCKNVKSFKKKTNKNASENLENLSKSKEWIENELTLNKAMIKQQRKNISKSVARIQRIRKENHRVQMKINEMNDTIARLNATRKTSWFWSHYGKDPKLNQVNATIASANETGRNLWFWQSSPNKSSKMNQIDSGDTVASMNETHKSVWFWQNSNKETNNINQAHDSVVVANINATRKPSLWFWKSSKNNAV